jgi:hypothetical protein
MDHGELVEFKVLEHQSQNRGGLIAVVGDRALGG